MPAPFSPREIDHVVLRVASLDRSVDFYVNVLGCTEASRSPDCIEVVSGALRLFLLRDPAPTHDVVVPSFDVPDRAAALRTLVAAGCTLVPIGPHSPDGVYVRVPHGVLFDVLERSVGG